MTEKDWKIEDDVVEDASQLRREDLPRESPPVPPAQQQQKKTSAVLEFINNDELMGMTSTVIAKLERPAFDPGRTSVFRTEWGDRMFRMCMADLTKLAAENGGDMPPNSSFDINSWYQQNIKIRGSSRHQHMRQQYQDVNRDIDPSVYMQPINVDWLTALIEMELHVRPSGYSFVRTLHNVLKLEDSAQSTLADLCKKERQYDFIGVSKPPPVFSGGPLLIKNEAEPGSAASLLQHSARKK